MLKDYIRKIRKAINESTGPIPIEIQNFYSALFMCCRDIPEEDVTPAIIQQLAIITQRLKCYITEPHDLKRQKLHGQVIEMIAPFKKFLPKVSNGIFKSIWDHFLDGKFIEHVKEERNKAQGLIQAFAQKNNKIRVHGCHQVSYNFWVNTFKADYAVHFDLFWISFLQYMNKQQFYTLFVSESSRDKIHEIVDPSRKYYITSANVNDLLVKMSQIQFLQILAEHTSLKNKSRIFESHSSLYLKYRKNEEVIQNSGSTVQCNLPEGVTIQINGTAVRCQGVNPILCKYPPTIRFGGLQNSDFWIKSKYISRRQFMIIEEPIDMLTLNDRTHNRQNHMESTEIGLSKSIHSRMSYYYIVCLSPCNYTCVVYPYRKQVKTGMIFKNNKDLIQITRISDSYAGLKKIDEAEQVLQLTQLDEQCEKTLQYLPNKQEFMVEKTVEYMYLTGANKNKKQTIDSNNPVISLSNGSKLRLETSANNFYIPSDIQILCKTSNQILKGHLSDKILLEKGMKITLDEVVFEIIFDDE